MTTDDLMCTAEFLEGASKIWSGVTDEDDQYIPALVHDAKLARQAIELMQKVGDYAATLERTNPLTDALTVARELKRLLEE